MPRWEFHQNEGPLYVHPPSERPEEQPIEYHGRAELSRWGEPPHEEKTYALASYDLQTRRILCQFHISMGSKTSSAAKPDQSASLDPDTVRGEQLKPSDYSWKATKILLLRSLTLVGKDSEVCVCPGACGRKKRGARCAPHDTWPEIEKFARW